MSDQYQKRLSLGTVIITKQLSGLLGALLFCCIVSFVLRNLCLCRLAAIRPPIGCVPFSGSKNGFRVPFGKSKSGFLIEKGFIWI